MPIYTNNLGLPTPLFLALKGKEHVRKSDISVTELGMSPRIVQLKRRHDKEIVVDVSDLAWAVFGSAVHNIIEKASEHDKMGIAEQYLTFQVQGPKGIWKVGGMVDYLEEDSKGLLTVTDWKVSSVWSYIFEKENGYVKKEFQEQLNVYDFGLSENKIEISDLKIGYLFRDWKKGDLAKAIAEGKEYPPGQIMLIPVPRWTRDEQLAYVQGRVKLHQEATDLPDDKLPVCTKEERWERGEAWAVYKKTDKRKAQRVFSSVVEATAYAGADKALDVIHRPGKSTRCLEYCDAAPFCGFYKSLMGQETVGAAS